MINKERNANLQITISKESLNKLEMIINELSKNQIIKPNKSQTIEFLINNYTLKNSESEQQRAKAKTEIKTIYSNRLKALGLKLNMSIPKLAESLNIPFNTFRKYYYGYTEPTEQNKLIIDKALKDNDIK